MSSSSSCRDTDTVPRVVEIIQSMSALVGADLDRKTIGLVLSLLNAGVSAESISDVILELKSEKLSS